MTTLPILSSHSTHHSGTTSSAEEQHDRRPAPRPDQTDLNTLFSLATAITLALRIWSRERKERREKALRRRSKPNAKPVRNVIQRTGRKH